MNYSRVAIDSLGYELPPNVVTTDALEARLAPVYRALRIQPGQLQALTGIRERRYWDDGQSMAAGAAAAAQRALEAANVTAADLGIVIFAGVCRDHLEPATACEVAHRLGVGGDAEVYDVSNACLGVLSGMIHVADAIESGRVRAGLVCSCESARPIVEHTIARLCAHPTMEQFKVSIATMTGGSGAAAVVLTNASLSPAGHRLVGGVIRAAPRHHDLCRWGTPGGQHAPGELTMRTDAPAVLEHGVALGVRTWHAFCDELDWPGDDPPKVICHQVGAAHRDTVLAAMEIPVARDFSTFEHLGNIGTVSLPLTAAIAEERGFLTPGDRVALLGIGSGLNCLMLGVEW